MVAAIFAWIRRKERRQKFYLGIFFSQCCFPPVFSFLFHLVAWELFHLWSAEPMRNLGYFY